MALTTSIKLAIAATLTSASDLLTAAAPLSYSKSLNLKDGTGANQADDMFSDRRTLSDGASEELDLAGSLTDAFGATINLTKVKALIIVSDDANTTDLTIGGAASNGFIDWVGAATHTLKLKPGGMIMLAAPDANGYAVTAGTADLLKIANAAGAGATYDIIVIGA